TGNRSAHGVRGHCGIVIVPNGRLCAASFDGLVLGSFPLYRVHARTAEMCPVPAHCRVAACREDVRGRSSAQHERQDVKAYHSAEDGIMTDPVFVTGLRRARRNWGWFLVLGLILIVLGIAALWETFLPLVTIISVLFFGWVLVIAGGVQILSSPFARESSGGAAIFLQLMAG